MTEHHKVTIVVEWDDTFSATGAAPFIFKSLDAVMTGINNMHGVRNAVIEMTHERPAPVEKSLPAPRNDSCTCVEGRIGICPSCCGQRTLENKS